MTPERIQQLAVDYFAQRSADDVRSWLQAHGTEFDDDWFAALASQIAASKQQGQDKAVAMFEFLRQFSRSAYLKANPAALKPYIDRILAADLSAAQLMLDAKDDDEREALSLALEQLGADDLGETPPTLIKDQYHDGPEKFTLKWPMAHPELLTIPWDQCDRLTQFHVLWAEFSRREREGLLARNEGRLDEATAIFNECLERAAQMDVATLDAQAWEGLATTAEKRADLARAREGFREARDWREKAGQPAAMIARRRDLAMVDFQDGEYLETESELTAILESLGEPTDNRLRVQRYYALVDRATVRRTLGRPEDALADSETAVSLLPDLPILLRRSVAYIGHQMRAKLFLEKFSPLFDPARAEVEAAALDASTPPELRWLPVEIRSQIAFQKADWRAAADLSAEAARLAEQGGLCMVVVYAQLRAAQALVALNDFSGADVLIQPVLEQFRREGHSDILGRAELTAARVRVGQSRADEAWELTRSSLAEIEIGVRSFRSLFDQHRFLQGHLADFADGFDVTLGLASSIGIDRAWSVAERAKGLYLSQIIANADIPLFEGVPPERRREIDQLESGMDALEAAAGALPAPSDSAQSRGRWQALSDKRNDLLSALMRDHPRWAAVRCPSPPDLTAIIAKLPAGWRLLSHFWREQPDRSAILHCFSHDAAGKIVHEPVPWSADQLGLLNDFNQTMDAGDHALAAYFDDNDGEILPADLVDQLIPASIRADWTAETRLLISAHGPSRSLPWPALETDGARLIERVTLQMIPTLGLLALDPSVGASKDVLLIGCEQDAFGDAPLSDVPEEIAALDGVWKAAGHEVSSEVVTTEFLKPGVEGWNRFGVIHLACHGDFPEDRPLDASLRLGGAVLRASELFGVRIGAGVMSLSACWVGRTAGADEGIGLQLPLLYAGVGRLVASLWPANSELARRFMTAFHQHLANGQPADRSFQQALLPMLQKSPVHWANWHLTGLPA